MRFAVRVDGQWGSDSSPFAHLPRCEPLRAAHRHHGRVDQSPGQRSRSHWVPGMSRLHRCACFISIDSSSLRATPRTAHPLLPPLSRPSCFLDSFNPLRSSMSRYLHMHIHVPAPPNSATPKHTHPRSHWPPHARLRTPSPISKSRTTVTFSTGSI